MTPECVQRMSDEGDHEACLIDFEQAMMRAEEAERIAAEAEAELEILRNRPPCLRCWSHMCGWKGQPCGNSSYRSVWE